MSVSIEPQGKGGKKALNAELNLVPYIDLLTCMVAFLLITAVWSQLAQLNTSQKGPGGDQDETPPTAKIAVVVGLDGMNVVVNQDREVVPDKQGHPDVAIGKQYAESVHKPVRRFTLSCRQLPTSAEDHE